MVRTVYTRRQRVLIALGIVAGFGLVVLLNYLAGPSPEPHNCLSACATSRQVLAREPGPDQFRTNP